MHQLPSLVLLVQAHALEAAAEGVVPAENIHSAVEPGGGHLFGSGTCFIQGFLERLFSFHLHWLGIKGKENSVTWGTEENLIQLLAPLLMLQPPASLCS